MGFQIWFQSVSEPVQAGLFIGVLMLIVFALGYWAGKRHSVTYNVQTGHFPVMPGATINTIQQPKE